MDAFKRGLGVPFHIVTYEENIEDKDNKQENPDQTPPLSTDAPMQLLPLPTPPTKELYSTFKGLIQASFRWRGSPQIFGRYGGR